MTKEIEKEQQNAIYWLIHEPLLAIEEGCRDPHKCDLNSMSCLISLLNIDQQRELIQRLDRAAEDVKSPFR
jgi:hypothetical protein